MSKVLVIAEAGVNNNGLLENSLKMIKVAAEAGADLVKFQTFQAANLTTRKAEMADYQKKNTQMQESQQAMLKKLELRHEHHQILIDECKKHNIGFFSTGFDIPSVQFLLSLGCEYIKVPSGEITNFPLLREIGQAKKKVILSTGMANIGEVEWALETLIRFGTKRENVTILHCTTEYPAPMTDVNLKAMTTIANTFKTPVGYSDHTLGTHVSIAAVAMGATVIEKHFTLDRNMPGPDHKASLEPDELKYMIKAIRDIEVALGDGIKKLTPSEKKNTGIARKSLVAAKNIKS